MGLTYFKRYKMEIRLDRNKLQDCDLPRGFLLLPWSERLLSQHASVKWESFRGELDSHVFPCLSEHEGCTRLMHEISNRSCFVPEATWLACRVDPNGRLDQPLDQPLTGKSVLGQPCGTVQGLLASPREGAIQNLGVHPDFRDQGIGRALLSRALNGFHAIGCTHVQLEVTVQNSAAIRLYERYGFRRVETLFKIADVVCV